MSAIGRLVGNVVGGITGASSAADASSDASAAQSAAAMAGVNEQRRQFDRIVELMSPFVSTGTRALEDQAAIAGIGDAGDQQRIIDSITSSPQYSTLLDQGEQALLQNASATGGLRGGNTQRALMEFRPQLISQLLENRYSRLGGLSGMGQASAANQAAAGQAAGSNISNLLQQQGAAQAGGILAQGGRDRQAFGDLLDIGTAVGGFF